MRRPSLNLKYTFCVLGYITELAEAVEGISIYSDIRDKILESPKMASLN